MADAPEDELAQLAYEAATRAQKVVASSVEAFRSHVIFVVSGGSVAVGFFANAALRSPECKSALVIASGVSTATFLVSAMIALRLRTGMAKEVDPDSMRKLPPSSAASLKFAVARRLARNVTASNAVLRRAQRELYVVVGLLAIALGLWIVTAVDAMP